MMKIGEVVSGVVPAGHIMDTMKWYVMVIISKDGYYLWFICLM